MKNKIKNLLDLFLKNRKLQIGVALLVIVALVAAVLNIAIKSIKNVTSYRETTVVTGNLTVGITESGTVDIGTVEQTFDLDMSALQRVTTSNSNSSNSTGSFGGDSGMGGMGSMSAGAGNSGSSGGGNMFSQMFNLGGSTSSSTTQQNSNLVIDEILISVGQEIKEGDTILTLESEGVEELKTELQENVDKVTADMEALEADQKLSKITADYTLQTSLQYGQSAGSEKDATINSLAAEVTTAQETLDAAKKSLSNYESQLVTAKSDYENAVIVMNNATWVIDNIDKNNDLYNYCNAYEIAKTAISNAESLENKVSQLESKIEMAKSNVSRSESNLASAKRNYESGKITAQENYELQMLAYNTAQETYDITISYLEDDLAEQQEKYDETLEKWDEFNSYIDGLNVDSKYNGIVTGVDLKSGDSLNTGSVVVTLYDADDISMTVSLSENKMSDIKIGGLANVKLTAYPDEVFEAEVTEIGDASTDSSGNVTYDVTVKIKGDVTKMFQGMSAEVTFITKQSTDVMYITNRAIIRENGISYVKVKKDNGTIDKVKVVTGFSDGTNVEIIEGLEEGQTVIIEKGEN